MSTGEIHLPEGLLLTKLKMEYLHRALIPCSQHHPFCNSLSCGGQKKYCDICYTNKNSKYKNEKHLQFKPKQLPRNRKQNEQCQESLFCPGNQCIKTGNIERTNHCSYKYIPFSEKCRKSSMRENDVSFLWDKISPIDSENSSISQNCKRKKRPKFGFENLLKSYVPGQEIDFYKQIICKARKYLQQYLSHKDRRRIEVVYFTALDLLNKYLVKLNPRKFLEKLESGSKHGIVDTVKSSTFHEHGKDALDKTELDKKTKYDMSNSNNILGNNERNTYYNRGSKKEKGKNRVYNYKNERRYLLYDETKECDDNFVLSMGNDVHFSRRVSQETEKGYAESDSLSVDVISKALLSSLTKSVSGNQIKKEISEKLKQLSAQEKIYTNEKEKMRNELLKFHSNATERKNNVRTYFVVLEKVNETKNEIRLLKSILNSSIDRPTSRTKLTKNQPRFFYFKGNTKHSILEERYSNKNNKHLKNEEKILGVSRVKNAFREAIPKLTLSSQTSNDLDEMSTATEDHSIETVIQNLKKDLKYKIYPKNPTLKNGNSDVAINESSKVSN